ncbi:MAG: ribosome maturation factor RimM [Pseudomonadota bacterium]
MSSSPRMVVVGQFAGSHGIRGEFKVRSFTDNPTDVASYGPVKTDKGRALSLSLLRELKPGLFLCSAPEISSPEACEVFKTALLHVPRESLPETEEDEFYFDDLLGAEAVTEAGKPAGRVKAIVNFGAGDLVELTEVPDRKGSLFIPFTREAVPNIDLDTRQLTVMLPQDDQDEQPPKG